MMIGVLEGYRIPRRKKSRRSTVKKSMRAKMKSCAKSHRVATKGFWTCVRAKKGRR
jgi:hypothetical protein